MSTISSNSSILPYNVVNTTLSKASPYLQPYDNNTIISGGSSILPYSVVNTTPLPYLQPYNKTNTITSTKLSDLPYNMIDTTTQLFWEQSVIIDTTLPDNYHNDVNEQINFYDKENPFFFMSLIIITINS